VRLAEAPMAGRGPLAQVRAVALELDPRRVRFELQVALREQGMRGAWTVDSLPADGVAAFNAGQFSGPAPWGWLVMDGREVQPAGTGTLAMAFVVDSAGRAALLEPRDLEALGARPSLAFQSYPALLVGNGGLPRELRARGRGADLDHRDSRLALGVRRDGTVLVALTRFTGFGTAGERLPWGPTVVEMAAWMRARGCRRAVLLDGGISGQMAVREAGGGVRRWPNLRPVPLGMVVRAR
jgi:exopolysaccharide biosynthesis protein